MTDVICRKCHQPFDEPHQYKACNSCREEIREYRHTRPEMISAENKRHYWANREEEIERRRKWSVDNPDKVKKWRDANQGRIRAWVDRYQKANPERVRESRLKSQAKHRQKRNAEHREWVKANHGRCKIYYHTRRANMKGNGGSFTLNELNAKFEQQEGFCYYCNELLYSSFDKDIHIDHKTPLCRGGSNNIENIAITCSKCNLTKHTKTEEEFLEMKELNKV